MRNPTTGKRAKSKSGARKGRKKKGTSWPVHYRDDEIAMIKAAQKKTGNRLSVSEVNRSAVRYAVPLFLSGEVDILTLERKAPLPSPTGR